VLLLPETDFHVRSYLRAEDPVATLSSLAHQTPFLFERRSEWLDRYFRQVWLSRGLRGLISSKIEFFPHQVEIARRVLQDPVVRYLLADEVGLGKTIEAGIILRQLLLDTPRLRLVVLAPSLLVHQWRDELATRFELGNVDVSPYENISLYKNNPPDILVIDEAHRIVTGDLYDAACRVSDPRRTPHLLLLSATPVLHHEHDLLALLHLLDPDSYRLDRLDEFRARLEKRRDLGRALLALSRSTRPAFTLRHVRHCAELLPDDPIVVETVELCAAAAAREDDENTLAIHAANLSMHLTETYRIHRRLLRTRRVMLLEEGELHQLRSEVPPLCEVQGPEGELVAELWGTLEEWRTRAAAHVVDCTSEQRRASIHLYLELAEAAASDRRRLAEILAERQRGLSVPGEADVVERLVNLAHRVGDAARADALLKFLKKLDKGRWVAFCGTTSRCTQLGPLIDDRWRGETFVITADIEAREAARRIAAFRNAKRAVLLADRIAEEGLNLQFADGCVFVDLPFDPMRLEQRLGRLDRLDRRKPVRCLAILSLGEPTLAFDDAWYEVLTKGLGLMNGSLADLQFLVERQLMRLGEIAFEGGPAALLAQASSLVSVVEAEREAAAEQDVLDGLYLGGLRDSALWQSIESADEEEDEFGDALQHYVEDNIGLRSWANEVPGKGRIVRFGLRRNGSPPLVPAALLHGLGDQAGRPATVRRTLATYDLDLQFLRPGQAFVEELRALADWDERGQAFALWRPAPGFMEPTFIFRFAARSFTGIDIVRHRLDSLVWDEVARGSLLRLLQIWRPQQIHHLYVDVDGALPEPRLVRLCSPPYDRERDINLGGVRARILLDLTGDAAWRALCGHVAERATAQIHSDPGFVTGIAESRKTASEHFDITVARLRARGRRHGEDSQAVARLIEEQTLLGQLVDSILAKPSLQIDSVGVYVLSERPTWQR